MMLQYLDTIIAFVVILLGVSLLITILNQMISALLGYRGTNLLWGIQTLLSTIEPGLSTKAEEMATKVLRKPIISDSIFSRFAKDGSVLGRLTKRWKLASAITPQELVRTLSNVAQTMATTPEGKPTADLINGMLEQVAPEAERNVKMVLETLQKLSPNTAIQMDKVVQELETTMQGSIGKVEAWFDTVMKRTSQRFTSQMRIWTIVFAVLFAFGAHLDSFKILEQLWTSPGLRASLVASGDAISREASEILSAQGGTTQSTGPSVSPQILGDAMKELIEKEKVTTAGLKVPERGFKNLDEALHGLRKSLTAGQVDQSREEMLVAKYRELVLSKWLDKEKGRANAIKEALAKAGFRLQIPTSCKEFRNFEEVSILGILVTAGLLSLGAPFWFNALKTLSNLRPLVASSEKKAATGSTQS